MAFLGSRFTRSQALLVILLFRNPVLPGLLVVISGANLGVVFLVATRKVGVFAKNAALSIYQGGGAAF